MSSETHDLRRQIRNEHCFTYDRESYHEVTILIILEHSVHEVLRISFVALRFQADEEERTSLRGFSSPLLEHCVPEGVLPFDVSLTSNLPLSEQDRQLSNARHTEALKTTSFTVLSYTPQLISNLVLLYQCKEVIMHKSWPDWHRRPCYYL